MELENVKKLDNNLNADPNYSYIILGTIISSSLNTHMGGNIVKRNRENTITTCG